MTFKTAPYTHQLNAFNVSCEEEDFALLMEAGTGKTKVVLDTATYLWEQQKIDTLIVVAPNNVHRNWLDAEAPKHCAAPYIGTYYKSGATKALLKEWDTMLHVGPSVLRLLTINIETISLKNGQMWLQRLMSGHKTMVVVDESQRIKTPGAKRTKAAYKLGASANYRRILSGTPVTKGYEDLYSQFKFLNPRIINCKTFAEFRSLYCIMGGFEFREVTGYQHVDQLLAKIAPYCFEANKRDCLDLPPQTWITRDIELGEQQYELYHRMRLEFTAELNNGHVIEAPLAIARLIRMQQIMSGFLPDGSGGIQAFPCPRIKETCDIIEEASRGKVIVWCRFTDEIALLKRELQRRRIHGVTYHGGMNPNARRKALDLFTNDPAYVCFLATRDSGGVGLTINAADTVVNHSHDWKWEIRTQAEARNHRIGQEHPVTYYNMRVPKTLDDKILAVLENRGELASHIKDMQGIRDLLS